MSQQYSGCLHQYGWMVVVDGGDYSHPCNWEKLVSFPKFLYSKDKKATNFWNGMYWIHDHMRNSTSDWLIDGWPVTDWLMADQWLTDWWLTSDWLTDWWLTSDWLTDWWLTLDLTHDWQIDDWLWVSPMTDQWLTDWWLTSDLTHDWPVTDWLMTDFGSHPRLTSD